MGYTTDFEGEVTIDPPLNAAEISYLRKFADTRHNKHTGGPYRTTQPADTQMFGPDVMDDRDHDGCPGYWCQWVPTDDGTALVWDGGEKFYNAEAWMTYLIDHFLAPGAHAQKNPGADPPAEFADFTFNHHLTGVVLAQGEEPTDRWRLWVTDNAVSRQNAHIVWD